MPATELRSPSEHKTTCTKSSLGSNFGRAENQDHQQILVPRQSSQDPLQVNPDITMKSEVRQSGTKSWFNIAKQLCPTSPGVKTHAQASSPTLKSRTKPKKIYKFKSTGKLPKNTTASSLFCKKPNDQVISPNKHSSSTLNWANTPFRNP